MDSQLFVLIACEESQAECVAFRELGHTAFSCDIQPCRKGLHPEWHIMGDVTPLLHGGVQFVTENGQQVIVPRWDLIIAHPPCTYLCKVGSPWLYNAADLFLSWRGQILHVNSLRYRQMCAGRSFFYECLGAKARYVAVENPLPMAIADLPKPTCYACPSWFGVKYTKKTLYWLRNLPPLFAEIEFPGAKEFVKSSRGKYRSRTFPQMAKGIAKQWSKYILDDLKVGERSLIY